MYTRKEIEEVKGYNRWMRKERGKRVKRRPLGGVTGAPKHVCTYCGRHFSPSMYSYESDFFNCCEECSLRRLPADLRGGYLKEASGAKSTHKSGVEQNTQLKSSLLEEKGYKVGTQGYPQNVEAFEEQKGGIKKPDRRGRPKKYLTPLEKRKAKQRYQQERTRKARERRK